MEPLAGEVVGEDSLYLLVRTSQSHIHVAQARTQAFIFPFFNYRMPEITRSLLMYRYRRLGEARAAAAKAGYKGAMFPWQSGSDGQEETRTSNLNPRSQRWVPTIPICSATSAAQSPMTSGSTSRSPVNTRLLRQEK